MKLLKKFVWLFASVALVACGNDDDNSTPEPAFELNQANLAGTYELTSYTKSETGVTVVGDLEVESSTEEATTNIQDVFLVLSSDNNFTYDGLYNLEVVTTTESGDTNTETPIVDIEDLGTYELFTDAETIDFSSTNGDISGTFDIGSFDEDTLNLEFFEMLSSGGVTTETTINYEFTRVIEE